MLTGYPIGEGVGVLDLTPAAQAPAPAVAAGTTDPTGQASTLEEITLELLTAAPAGLSRLEVQQRLGVNKNRAAYVLRKLEQAGSIVATGSARATRYAVA